MTIGNAGAWPSGRSRDPTAPTSGRSVCAASGEPSVRARFDVVVEEDQTSPRAGTRSVLRRRPNRTAARWRRTSDRTSRRSIKAWVSRSVEPLSTTPTRPVGVWVVALTESTHVRRKRGSSRNGITMLTVARGRSGHVTRKVPAPPAAPSPRVPPVRPPPRRDSRPRPRSARPPIGDRTLRQRRTTEVATLQAASAHACSSEVSSLGEHAGHVSRHRRAHEEWATDVGAAVRKSGGKFRLEPGRPLETARGNDVLVGVDDVRRGELRRQELHGVGGPEIPGEDQRDVLPL